MKISEKLNEELIKEKAGAKAGGISAGIDAINTIEAWLTATTKDKKPVSIKTITKWVNNLKIELIEQKENLIKYPLSYE